MAKRFTDTDKWKDEWFLSLSNDHRILWLYMVDNCSHSGILKKNLKHMNFCCNTTITVDNLGITFWPFFKDRVIDMDRFFFIPKFLKFQYPLGLNSEKPAVLSVRNDIISFGLFEILREWFGNDYIIVKDKDKDKDKDKGKEGVGEKPKKGEQLNSGLHFCHNCESYFNEKKYEGHLKSCRKATF